MFIEIGAKRSARKNIFHGTKKKKTKVQEAAAKRHETFKKTGVQTFGGTKKRYS